MSIDHILDGSSNSVPGAVNVDFEELISVISPAMVRRLPTLAVGDCTATESSLLNIASRSPFRYWLSWLIDIQYSYRPFRMFVQFDNSNG